MSSNHGLTLQCPKSRRDGGCRLTDLDFADDLALLSDNIAKAQQLLPDLEEAASKVGLQLNANKRNL